MSIDEVRRFSLSLPETTEEPHHHFSSFRVAGKIFVTVPPEEKHIHVFVDELKKEMMPELDPLACEKLWWGKKVVGLRVTLAKAKTLVVEELILNAWQRKAPKRLLKSGQ